MDDALSDSAVVDRLLEAIVLKDVERAGWLRVGIEAPESVAAHSWGVAFLVLALLPEDHDLERALSYAVLHDLAEVRVGDITPQDEVSRADKIQREQRAMDQLLAGWSRGGRLKARWERYEAQQDSEARFVRQLDRLDMALQAVAYAERDHLDLAEFLRSAERVVTHPKLLPIMHELHRRHRSAHANKHRPD